MGALLDALASMPRLEVLVLPLTGWNTPQEYWKIIRALPKVVVPQMHRGQQGSSKREDSSHVHAASVVGPEVDVTDAEGIIKGPMNDRHPCYVFHYNENRYQTTVGRAGSHTEAARIARL